MVVFNTNELSSVPKKTGVANLGFVFKSRSYLLHEESAISVNPVKPSYEFMLVAITVLALGWVNEGVAARARFAPPLICTVATH